MSIEPMVVGYAYVALAAGTPSPSTITSTSYAFFFATRKDTPMLKIT